MVVLTTTKKIVLMMTGMLAVLSLSTKRKNTKNRAAFILKYEILG